MPDLTVIQRHVIAFAALAAWVACGSTVAVAQSAPIPAGRVIIGAPQLVAGQPDARPKFLEELKNAANKPNLEDAEIHQDANDNDHFHFADEGPSSIEPFLKARHETLKALPNSNLQLLITSDPPSGPACSGGCFPGPWCGSNVCLKASASCAVGNRCP